MIRKIPLILGALAAPVAAQSLNPPLTDPADVDRQVAAFAGQAAPPVDRRLRLARCAAPLALNWYGADQAAVQVRCSVPGGWTLYVPLRSAATAAAPLVQRGDAVLIQVRGDGWAVSQPGEALEAGPAGSWIKVRGLAPKAPILRGKVLGAGVVGLEAP